MLCKILHNKDKAPVERAVQIVYTSVYAPLRNQKPTSIGELNCLIQEQLNKLNNKLFYGRKISREELFTRYESKALHPLPERGKYLFKKFLSRTVQVNYHVLIPELGCYYSVPYQYRGKKVQVLYDYLTVEIYLDNQLIAKHILSHYQPGQKFATNPEHRCASHQAQWENDHFNEEDFLRQATAIGPNTCDMIKAFMAKVKYIEHSFKTCKGLLVLKNKYSAPALEQACKVALENRVTSLGFIRDFLFNQMDAQKRQPVQSSLPFNDTVRGRDTYK
jgi:hypothetical protein